jgi:hypothetical protein
MLGCINSGKLFAVNALSGLFSARMAVPAAGSAPRAGIAGPGRFAPAA